MRGVVAMECCTGLVSLLVTAFSLCSVAGSQTGSQGLMYFYFQSFSAPELPAFFRIVMLDDLQIDYYNSTLHEVEVKHQWIADALLTDYQKEQKEVTDRLHEFIMTHLQQLSSIVNISYIQGILGCTASGNTDNVILKINIPDFLTVSLDISVNSNLQGLIKAGMNQLNFTEGPDLKYSIQYLKRAVQLGKEASERQVAPEAQVLTRRPTATAGESLSCIITPFYPRAIKATWLKNGQVVSEGYKVTVLPNYNDTYWMELVIELQGNNPNIYACRVEHSSLTQALVLKGGVGEPHCAGPMLGMMTVFAIIFGVM
ncbi:major histocompatibility complex class I-related gene protein-like isoform X1 [Hypanus sabinus]|uniref:major histocompatibility complex class I-related gene protein-like isoform X1 n=1 Tax=Hypanus sabinus TaxID=79690 RepID=UPI0028C3BE38|nr:major histocompatibility complex class I-related gene protein-like isoform X1 [Hypanus sabinus]XP_059826641.1 major histocompatibility complex class I-related gene protein-like isoform X1 [Hypanus sabinus]